MQFVRPLLTATMAIATWAATAAPAGACAGLIGPGGNVRLLRTATLAAYHDGVEHYVTSFQFEGGGAEFGSIVPLLAIPSKVERGGDWTLQRLERETQPQPEAAPVAAAAREDSAEVVYETRIDALDIRILRGGARQVGTWAREHGFSLTPDAPEVLDFYAGRSPIFMAASFDAAAARERGQEVGDGTPIHLTIPTANPWVPLRILGLGRQPDERIAADVYLLTDGPPALLPAAGIGLGAGLTADRYEAASRALLDDLRADKGMEWMPDRMWLTFLRVDESAGRLRYDLAVDASGRGRPSRVAAGLAAPAPPTTLPPPATTTPATTAPPTVAAAVTQPAPSTSAPSALDPGELATSARDDDSTDGSAGALVVLATVGLVTVATGATVARAQRRRRSQVPGR